MFQRWKLILSNWINCYFSKSSEDEQNLNIKSLVTIISQLRENLNLDESKSSILEAHTVEEFLCEKYPEFKFENGTVKASNDEEICLSASLLLFFVCVNSKNFDIKHAMCSKLSGDDQETILKFSKCLMECPVISVGEVQAAITEACGQDIAAMELPRQSTIAETPPALRSLHGQVRRLQAALDAEKFDRNYLQEELSRTNNKLERLSNEKEQHKLEILNLKAKISFCCGAEAVAKNAEAVADVSAKLTRQLQQLEMKLEETQTQLDDISYERDSYKAKMDELKNDRDKLLALSQQEIAKVSQLSEELETERSHNQSLKDLVTELRQHNRLNGLDCSVECDDPDASAHSLQHNSSICSEVCANVVEVQLSEERAKMVVLEQQIQTLQVQINELNQIREADKTTLKNVIAQKENDICNLKHRINEEIEKKNNLKAHCDNEKTKLNNKINELDQKFKENYEYSNAVIEKKIEEIHTLKEEKQSLLHMLNNETTKLDNIIRDLQCELDTEKLARSRMKEGYENHSMKLNEKLLNRNNELVELQNSIFEKGEQIEKLQIEVRNDKEEYNKLLTKYESLNENMNTMQYEFKKENEAYKELMSQHLILNEWKNEFQMEVKTGKEVYEELMTKYLKVVEENDTIKKELAREQEVFKELNNKYQDINEQNNTAQTDLKKVKEAGKKLQNKYHTQHEHHKELKIEIVEKNKIIAELRNKYEDLDKQNKAIQTELVKNKEAFEVIHHKYENVITQKNLVQNELEKAKEMVNELGNKCLHLEKENNTIQTGLQKLNVAFEQLTNDYQEILNQNNIIKSELNNESDAIKELLDKYQRLEEKNYTIQSEFHKEKRAFEELTEKYQESVKQNNTMELELKKQKETFEELLHEYRNLDEHRNTIENDLRLKCDEELSLKLDLENKVHSLKEELTESENLTYKLKTSYEYQIESLNVMVTKLTNCLKDKSVEVEALRRDKDTLQQTVGDSCKAIKSLQEELITEKQNIERLTFDFEAERQVLKNMVTVTESVMEDTKTGLNNEIAEHLKAKYSLEVQKSELHALLNDLEMKYQAVENANASLISLLRIEKKGKEDVETESELVRDYLDEIVRCLSKDKKTNATMIQTLETQNQALTEHNEKLKKDLNELEVAANDLENEFKSREEKLEILYEEKSQQEDVLKETANNLALVQLEVKDLESKIADMTHENLDLKLKENECLAQIDELKHSLSTFRTKLRTREDELNIALEEKKLAESNLQSLADTLKVALDEKTDIENNLQDKIQILNVAQIEIKELKNKIVVLSDENNNLKLEENESFSKINELKSAMSALENDLRNKFEIISQEKLQLNNELQALSNKLKTSLGHKAQLENTLHEQTQNFSAVQLENKELKNRIITLVDENNNLKQDSSESSAKLEEYKVKEYEYENNLEKSQYLINNLKVAMKAVEDELETQNHKMLDLSDENNNLKQDKEENLAKIEEFQAKIEKLEEVQKIIVDMKVAMNVLENSLETREDTLKTILQEESQVENDLQSHVIQLAKVLENKSQVENTLEATAQNLTEVQHGIKNLTNKVTDLLCEKNKLEVEKKECSSKINELQSKIEDLEAIQNVNQELKVTINDLESQLKTQVDKLQTLSQEKSEIENALQTYTDQFANISEEKSQIEKALQEKTAQEKTHSDMITKLTNYLKEKTVELENLRKDKDILQQTVGDSCKVIKSLEDNVKTEKRSIDKLSSDFESERQMLKNMVSATESVMEDTKLGLLNEISQQLIAKDCLEVEKKGLQNILNDLEMKHQALEMANASLLSLLKLERKAKQEVEKESEIVRDYLDELVGYLSKERNTNISVISALEFQEKVLVGDYEKIKHDLEVIQTTNQELKVALKTLENELLTREDKLQKTLEEKSHVENELKMHADQLRKVLDAKSQIEEVLNGKMQNLVVVQLEIKELKSKMADLFNEKSNLELEKSESCAKMKEFKAIIDLSELKEKEELSKLKSENQQLLATIEENRTVITNLEQLIKHELEENHKLRDENEQQKLDMANRISMLTKAEKVLEERQKEIVTLQEELKTLQSKVELSDQDSKAKDGLISKMSKEKDAFISTISKELVEEKAIKEKLEKESLTLKSIVSELKNNIEIRALKKENEQLIRVIGQQETFTALSQEKATEKYACHQEARDTHQVDSSSSDNTHSSVESLKTITDLEKIICDKNRTITTLQTDITYLKSLMAESETKLLDVTKELEISKDNAQELSNQLKKIVNQKNEEILDLKKQVTKMSATENRATQIIKVSAKYQAMILKRVAEIKSNTVLKELTNFGNSDNELRRTFAGSITMEDLESFLETTDRHLKRCSEKQIVLQKERDRLSEINRIHESEIINLKKFLTELSVSFQTFSSVKDLYGHKLSRVISVQRTVRREILNLDGRISDATMCKLERGYGAAMQDLAECTMNLERWVERCISRTVSVEKIKQAFTSDTERSSLASPSFQNTGLEIQMEELEKSFQKLLEEIARAVKSEGATETQAATVMEVRAEYEDKLNRMKAKMKELFNEQMALLKNKQREDIELLERELQKTRSSMEASKRAYESHIKDLTKELWSVGEKYLVKNDEAEWLRRKQRSGSLMSLQHVHSSGLVLPQEPLSRPSDAHSLRSLPNTDKHPKSKRDGRGLHMSDEEGEVFDNRCLKELAMTPRREPPGQRLSELKWRNSLCPPHLKSSYPAETQFASTLDEEDLKVGASAPGTRLPRKEVGITAYKKPGPPTPSKQAGRLSATDSELRESVRVENDPQPHTERKTSTPARLRAFLRRNKHDSNEGTPRARRLSSIFRKK